MVVDKTGNAIVDNDFLDKAFQSPFNKIMGIKITKVHRGSIELELETIPDFANGSGNVHGGVTATLCDSAMGFAAMTLGVSPVTVEMKLNYLLPGHIGDKLIAKGKVIREGKTLIIVDCEIYSREKLIAKGLGTYIVQKSEDDLKARA